MFLPMLNNLHRNNVPSMFDDFINSIYDEEFNPEARMMSLDVFETDKAYILKANLPGVDKKNVKISAKNQQLKISANLEEEKSKKESKYHIRERYCGEYQRTIKLPEDCNTENIQAKMEDGVLSVTIEKNEPEPSKEIKIN